MYEICYNNLMQISKQPLLTTFLELIAINEVFPYEEKIITYVQQYLERVRLRVVLDHYHNVIAYREGVGDPIMLNTHMDIPEPAPHIEYTIDGDIVKSKGKSILGADPKSGLAALLELAQYLNEYDIKTRPIEFVFTRGEEVGLLGARNIDMSLIHAKEGIVIDEDGPPTNIVMQAPGITHLYVDITGKTVHSRDWHEGVNAIAHIAHLITQLKQGEIAEGVTFNIGVIEGGTAVNSIAGHAAFRSEFRSFNMEYLRKAVDEVEKHIATYSGSHHIDISVHIDHQSQSYCIPQEHRLLVQLQETYKQLGWQPNMYATFGASDANIFNTKGIATITIGSGYYDAHKYTESINLSNMVDLVQLLHAFVKV